MSNAFIHETTYPGLKLFMLPMEFRAFINEKEIHKPKSRQDLSYYNGYLGIRYMAQCYFLGAFFGEQESVIKGCVVQHFEVSLS